MAEATARFPHQHFRPAWGRFYEQGVAVHVHYFQVLRDPDATAKER